MVHFWQNGGADFCAAVSGIFLFVGIGLSVAWRIRSGKIKVAVGLKPGVSEIAAAAEMLYHVAAPHPKRVWLLARRGNERFRISVTRGFYVVERMVPYAWPPRPGSEVRVEAVVVRTDLRHLTRYIVDATVMPDGEIPLTTSMLATGLMEFKGFLYAQIDATVADMTEWARCIDAATAE